MSVIGVWLEGDWSAPLLVLIIRSISGHFDGEVDVKINAYRVRTTWSVTSKLVIRESAATEFPGTRLWR